MTLSPITIVCIFIFVAYVGVRMIFIWLDEQEDENMNDEECMEWVIEQAKEAYIKGEISVEQLEEQVYYLLRGKTPVNSQGWPIYYDPRLLDTVNY